jgi:hypothetical protein
MKKLLLALLILIPFLSSAQTGNNSPQYYFKGTLSVGKGTTAYADSSAYLEIGNGSDHKGIIAPRVADTNAIINPKEGLFAYDKSSHILRFFNGTQWKEIGGGNTNSSVTGSGLYKINDTLKLGFNIASIGTTNEGLITEDMFLVAGDLLTNNYQSIYMSPSSRRLELGTATGTSGNQIVQLDPDNQKISIRNNVGGIGGAEQSTIEMTNGIDMQSSSPTGVINAFAPSIDLAYTNRMSLGYFYSLDAPVLGRNDFPFNTDSSIVSKKYVDSVSKIVAGSGLRIENDTVKIGLNGTFDKGFLTEPLYLLKGDVSLTTAAYLNIDADGTGSTVSLNNAALGNNNYMGLNAREATMTQNNSSLTVSNIIKMILDPSVPSANGITASTAYKLELLAGPPAIPGQAYLHMDTSYSVMSNSYGNTSNNSIEYLDGSTSQDQRMLIKSLGDTITTTGSYIELTAERRNGGSSIGRQSIQLKSKKGANILSSMTILDEINGRGLTNARNNYIPTDSTLMTKKMVADLIAIDTNDLGKHNQLFTGNRIVNANSNHFTISNINDFLATYSGTYTVTSTGGGIFKANTAAGFEINAAYLKLNAFAKIQTDNLTTTNRVYQLPDTSGTIALVLPDTHSSGAITLKAAGYYTFEGVTGIWTLPAIAGNT